MTHPNMNRTGFVWHERYAWHDTGNWAGMLPSGGFVEPYKTFEKAETKRRLYSLLAVSGMLGRLVPVAPRPVTDEEALRFHTPAYLAHLSELSARGGGDAGEFAPMGPDSYPIAQLAAGGLIEATDAVLEGRVDNAYALVRPPGHHAERDRARGFCFLANIALAARHALARHGLGRIAIVDWDVHHGNGTQQAFYDDPQVLTISLHQDRLYPFDSGMLSERGEGKGYGANINLPLPPGCGHGAYLHAIEQIVLPALHTFRPDLIFVACGFDACMTDPLGRMGCVSDTYRAMMEMVMGAARELCGGRLVVSHEGGYSAEYVPFCGLAAIEAMTGFRSEVVDACNLLAVMMPGYTVEPHQAAAIDTAKPLLAGLSRL